MAQASWYETGYEGADREAERKALGYPPDRWWLKAGDSKELVYADDDPSCIKVHSFRDTNDRWFHETCIAKISEAGCPACGAKGVGRADYTGHYTIIDITGYTAKDGTEHKYRLMLLPAKTKFLGKLKKKKETKGSLLGQLWTLTRADSNAPNTGDDLDHVREINVEGLFPLITYKGKNLKDMIERANAGGAEGDKTRKYLSHHFRLPEGDEPIPLRLPVFNYPALMAPKEPSKIRELIADAKPFNQQGGSNSNSSKTGSSADEVPF